LAALLVLITEGPPTTFSMEKDRHTLPWIRHDLGSRGEREGAGAAPTVKPRSFTSEAV
jgi:hypothetical protein